MYHYYDPDEYETVIYSRPCNACNGDMSKCNGRCNGSSGYGLKRRDPAEVAKIKADRKRKEEDEILAKADAIRAMRSCG